MEATRKFLRAFVLQEAVALVFVCAAVAVFVVMCGRSRALASLGESMANLRRMHQSTAQYGEDNAAWFATFSWKKGNHLSAYTDLQNPVSDVQAAADQAVDIIRRRAGVSQAGFPRITGWIPNISYSHLVLSEYLGTDLPMRWVISPEDPKRLAFALDRSQWFSAGASNARFAFSSSYEIPVAFWSSPDSGSGAVSQNVYSQYAFSSSTEMGGRRLDEVAYPSQKAVYYDRHQRHFGPRQGFFMHDEARVPVAAADGAVSVRRGKDANQGWYPPSPFGQDPSFILYNPSQSGPFAWDPPALDPSGSDQVVGRYRFTRGALAGRDFDGPEVP